MEQEVIAVLEKYLANAHMKTQYWAKMASIVTKNAVHSSQHCEHQRNIHEQVEYQLSQLINQLK